MGDQRVEGSGRGPRKEPHHWVSLWWACLRDSKETSDDGAGERDREEIRAAGRGRGTCGLVVYAKDFGFHAKRDGEPLEGFDSAVM